MKRDRRSRMHQHRGSVQGASSSRTSSFTPFLPLGVAVIRACVGPRYRGTRVLFGNEVSTTRACRKLGIFRTCTSGHVSSLLRSAPRDIDGPSARVFNAGLLNGITGHGPVDPPGNLILNRDRRGFLLSRTSLETRTCRRSIGWLVVIAGWVPDLKFVRSDSFHLPSRTTKNPTCHGLLCSWLHFESPRDLNSIIYTATRSIEQCVWTRLQCLCL